MRVKFVVEFCRVEILNPGWARVEEADWEEVQGREGGEKVVEQALWLFVSSC